jgi:hypothetical protein
MNTINAGNPSANNMITRQVMQKKRESSSTIFDKLSKRTAQLTTKNPLNNVLTNEQLFRYYIQEVEPKLSQSNDNFQGLPNTTPQIPPDTSIKDTVEKSYGNVKDEYNTGFSGNGVEGILNSNDINSMTSVGLSDPQIPVVLILTLLIIVHLTLIYMDYLIMKRVQFCKVYMTKIKKVSLCL